MWIYWLVLLLFRSCSVSFKWRLKMLCSSLFVVVWPLTSGFMTLTFSSGALQFHRLTSLFILTLSRMYRMWHTGCNVWPHRVLTAFCSRLSHWEVWGQSLDKHSLVTFGPKESYGSVNAHAVLHNTNNTCTPYAVYLCRTVTWVS